MIVVATYATKRYSYAMPNFGRRIASAIQYAGEKKGTFLFVTDESEEMRKCANDYIATQLPEGWQLGILSLPLKDDDLRNYKNDAQLLIAQMQSYAFSEARRMGADVFWSVESDVLVPYNALKVSKQILKFDEGYYDVVMCSYPSQGGGSFLGGRGTYEHPIAEDYLPEERDIPDELKAKLEEREKEMQNPEFRPSEEWFKERHKLHEEIKQHPPKDNIFKVIGDNGWRKRGWMDAAYPALGKGCILPTDWVGMGCTMLSKKALAMAHFDGYQGGGTQDLFLCWHHWNPKGLNMAVCTHAICDHVVRARAKSENEEDKDGQSFDKFIHVEAYHEPEGDYAGHLRQRHNPHYAFVAGEKYSEENNGRIYEPSEEEIEEHKAKAKEKAEKNSKKSK